MRAKQIYEIINESIVNLYENGDIEGHRKVRFKSGPFKGYELGDIVDNLPETMGELYKDMVPVNAQGEKFKDSLYVLLNNAKNMGKTKDDANFRSYFPNLSTQLIRYGKNAGYTLGELHRFKPNAEMNMGYGGELSATNPYLANKVRLQTDGDEYDSQPYNDNSEKNEVKYKDPRVWAKGKKIITDVTAIIEKTYGKLRKTRYEGEELDVELEMVGVTTDGYPIMIHMLASKISEDYLYLVNELSTNYTEIIDENLQIHMLHISRCVNEGVREIDGRYYVNVTANRDNVDFIDPEIKKD